MRGPSMRTPLARVRNLGSSHSGTSDFWRQRMTAVANIPLVMFLILSVVTHIGAPYADVKAYLAQPLVALLFLALAINAAETIVGESNDSQGASRAFVHANGAMIDLNAVTSGLNGAVLTTATAINDAGQIVGRYFAGGGDHGFLMVTGPNPPPPAGTTPYVCAALGLISDGLGNKVPTTLMSTTASQYGPGT